VVEHDGGVHVVAQEGEVALEGGERHLQRFEQHGPGYQAPFREQASNAHDAVGLAHGGSLEGITES